MAVVVAGAVVLLAVAVALVVFVLPEDGGPDAVAGEFAAAWSDGDSRRLAPLVVDPAALEALDPVQVSDRLGATRTAIAVGSVEQDGDRAEAAFTATLSLPAVGRASWQGSLDLVESEDRGWLVDWAPRGLHPALPEGGRLRRTVTWPERAPILGVDGEVLAGPVDEVLVGIEPRRLEDRAAATAALSAQLGVDPSEVDAALDAPGVQPDHFVPVVQVRREAYDAVRDVIRPIPGLLFREVVGRGGPAPGFARHVVGRFGEVTAERLEELGPPYEVGDLVGLDGLEARFESRLAGRPAVAVEAVDADGEVLEVLAEHPATAPEPIRTTIDVELQAAADAVITGLGAPAALAAVDAATGEVRAITSAPVGEAFNRATAGAYPPGSTFKVVTAAALLANGTGLDTPVDCPARLVVDGKAFRNFEGGASGRVPFSQAFAESCNTAVIGAAQGLPEGALVAAATSFGFGLDYTLGPRTVGGSFPPPATRVDRAAAAIGQGGTTASPLHMATVAGAVVDGAWRTPVLLRDEADAAEQVVRALDTAVVEQLRTLMRLVVTDGSGSVADVPGLDVLGKTGTAEYGSGDPPPTHAWFIAGARGLGIAVIVEDRPAGGRDAAPVVAELLRLPTGGSG